MPARSRQTGFSLVELLIAMALLALLMVSIATAVHASFKSYETNERIAAATQATRTVLGRMMQEVRTASDVECTSMELTIYPPEDDSSADKLQYSLEAGALIYRRWVGTSVSVHTLLGGDDDVTVNSFTVFAETDDDGEGGTIVKSVTVSLSISVGDETLPVTTSAALRKNQEY